MDNVEIIFLLQFCIVQVNIDFFQKKQGGDVKVGNGHQIVEIKKIEVEMEDIQACFPAPIRLFGNS